jgi:PIN domain
VRFLDVVPSAPEVREQRALGFLREATTITGDLIAPVADVGLGLREAPLTSAIALESRRLSLPTQDPADRFIAATAEVHDCSLVTADVALRRIRGVRVVFCRAPKRRRPAPAT